MMKQLKLEINNHKSAVIVLFTITDSKLIDGDTYVNKNT